jgi:release factor glutamine methyltransferase
MERYGPLTVDGGNISVLEYFLKAFPSLSKRKVKECIRHGFLTVDATIIADERYLVRQGNIILIERNTSLLHQLDEQEKVEALSQSLNVVYVDHGVAVVVKDSGISGGNASIFDRVVKQALFRRTGMEYYSALYHLAKGVRGLILYAASAGIFDRMARNMISSPPIDLFAPGVRLVYHCILCGRIGEESESKIIHTDDIVAKSFHITILQVTRSTSTEYLSAVNINPVLEYDPSSDASSITRYITSYFKSLRNALRRLGHPIVGDADMVKSSKGLFATMTSVCIAPGVLSTEGIDVSIDVFDKFRKVIDREHQYWERNRHQSQLRIQESNRDVGEDDSPDCDMPVEYVLGEASFCNLTFDVNKDVMIPRKSSETLVSAARDIIRDQFASVKLTVLDIGTGSGCLLISLLNALSANEPSVYGARGLGVDISPAALVVARLNAARMNQVDICSFVELSFECLDMLPVKYPIDDSSNGMFTIVICNPPYSSEKESHRLSTSRKLYEPSVALFSASGPYGCYVAIAEAFRRNMSSCSHPSHRLLIPGGYLVIEVGHGQYEKVVEIFTQTSFFKLSRIVKDHKLIDRCLVFQIIS